MCPLIVLDSDIAVRCGYGIGLFTRKRTVCWQQHMLIGLLRHGLQTPVGDALLAQGEKVNPRTGYRRHSRREGIHRLAAAMVALMVLARHLLPLAYLSL